MTERYPSTNVRKLRQYGDSDDVIEALAIWACNRQAKRVRNGARALHKRDAGHICLSKSKMLSGYVI